MYRKVSTSVMRHALEFQACAPFQGLCRLHCVWAHKPLVGLPGFAVSLVPTKPNVNLVKPHVELNMKREPADAEGIWVA